MRTVIIGAMASVVAACASIGRPEGGPRDETPPEFVRSTPAPGSTGVDRNRIDIFFNENVKLEDIQNKLVVSPAQMQQPVARANGRRVTLELRDSLRDSTTYTIDFSDAVRDLNEGNILDGFAMDFSTGSTIDTLRISGMVFQAENLEPAQGMVVGVYSNLADSAIRTLPLERVAKTNQLGQFTIRGLKPGTYQIFAIDDRNRDWHWDRSEAVAFSSVTLSPGVVPVEVADTLQGSEHQDSIVFRTAYHYMPDDVLLTLVTNVPELRGPDRVVAALREECPEVTSIVQNVNTRRTNAILGKQNRTLWGTGVMHDKLLGCTFEIGPSSFYQTNPEQTEVLYQLALDAADLEGGMSVLDAYCGTGTIGICAAAANSVSESSCSHSASSGLMTSVSGSRYRILSICAGSSSPASRR